MIRVVAPARGLVEFDPTSRKRFLGEEEVRTLGSPAKSQHRFVFEQKECIRDFVLSPLLGPRFHERHGLPIGDATERDGLEFTRHG